MLSEGDAAAVDTGVESGVGAVDALVAAVLGPGRGAGGGGGRRRAVVAVAARGGRREEAIRTVTQTVLR